MLAGIAAVERRSGLGSSAYARMVCRDEVEKNDFNLNLPRYIDSQSPEDRQDIEGHLKDGMTPASANTATGSSANVMERDYIFLAADEMSALLLVTPLSSSIWLPAFIMLNAVGAAHACDDFIHFMTGLVHPGLSLDHARYDGRTRTGSLSTPRADMDCPECGCAPEPPT